VEENLFLAAAARENRKFHLFGRWRASSDAHDWVRAVAEQVHLSEHLGARVAELSHGLHRQLEVGMAIALRPRLIMLDEPAAGLSPTERALLARLINGLSRDFTLVLIEHDMDIVLEIADQITVLHRGAVIAEGTPAEIRANQEVQQVYLGHAYN
jgi:branched-chain amino acid transport system ATP-binding protein